jgi:hypothetical protein
MRFGGSHRLTECQNSVREGWNGILKVFWEFFCEVRDFPVKFGYFTNLHRFLGLAKGPGYDKKLFLWLGEPLGVLWRPTEKSWTKSGTKRYIER